LAPILHSTPNPYNKKSLTGFLTGRFIHQYFLAQQ